LGCHEPVTHVKLVQLKETSETPVPLAVLQILGEQAFPPPPLFLADKEEGGNTRLDIGVKVRIGSPPERAQESVLAI
jgi:hypothetical protein